MGGPVKTIAAEMSLAEVINTRPMLARELERLGLDYCCGGERTVADACARKGLDPAAVVAALSRFAADGADAPWATMSVTQLVDHIETTHHRYLWAELPRLSDLLGKIARVHGERHAELADICHVYRELRVDLEPHLDKEEQVVFPMIRLLAGAQAAPTFHAEGLVEPIAVLLAEHDRVGELLAQLRALTHGYEVPDDGCASYLACYERLAELEADTHMHVHKENNLLFPAVARMDR
jgi:regulator of cell morphogenesis and NO signaling